MARYIIGDVHGCFDSFQALLHRLGYRDDRDQLTFVGDVVNRGPKSREVLAWIYQRRDAVEMVLGNHDLHLLCCVAGLRKPKALDTFDEIVAASDRWAWIDWLRRQPLMLMLPQRVVTHAGLLPAWSVSEGREQARLAEGAFGG